MQGVVKYYNNAKSLAVSNLFYFFFFLSLLCPELGSRYTVKWGRYGFEKGHKRTFIVSLLKPTGSASSWEPSLYS